MAKKVELTKEELWEKEKEHELDFIKRELPFIPEPSYHFNVGDEVAYGRLKNVVVDEVLYDGKIYVLRATKREENCGSPKGTEVCRACSWLNIRPLTKGFSDFTRNEDVKLYFSSSTIESILHMAYSFGVDFEPEYQRGLVWSDEDKQKLLWSVFNNVDIGKFVFVHLNGAEWHEKGTSYEILDGKQRLTTLMEFYENKLPYQGVYYNDLSGKDRYTFLQHNADYANIENADKETRLKYFLMLNRGGRPMDEAHLDKIEEMLEEMTEEKDDVER